MLTEVSGMILCGFMIGSVLGNYLAFDLMVRCCCYLRAQKSMMDHFISDNLVKSEYVKPLQKIPRDEDSISRFR